MQGSGPLYDELHTLLRGGAPAQPAGFLAGLPRLLRERGAPPLLIVTTSYDPALERAFDEARRGADWSGTSRRAEPRPLLAPGADGSPTLIESRTRTRTRSPEKRTVVLRLRGGVDRSPERERESFVVTEDDYIGYLDGELTGSFPVAVAARLRRSHFLFLGYESATGTSAVLSRIWGERRSLPLVGRSALSRARSPSAILAAVRC